MEEVLALTPEHQEEGREVSLIMRLVLLGPPGCGKGTYSRYLANLLSAQHISTGDLIRAEIRAGSDVGKELHCHVDCGQLIPDNLLFKVLNPVLRRNGTKQYLPAYSLAQCGRG